MNMRINYNIAFCGDLSQNNGPANVNKNLIKYLKCTKIDTKSKNKVILFFEVLISLFKCKIFIFSSNYRTNYVIFIIATFFGKKTVYLMHGCSQLDAKINKVKNADRMIKMEKSLVKNVGLILVVSETYMNLVKNIFSNDKKKFHFLTSGIDLNLKQITQESPRINNIIAVCGGNRFIKCNNNVSLAIKELNNKNQKKIYLNIYGLLYQNNECIETSEYVKIKGRLKQEELYKELRKTKLFILNSKYESFGLSIIDALLCGCNILISNNCGIKDMLSLGENDVINDYNDLEEIQKKIEYNLTHDNNERILRSIDYNKYSWQSVSNRLEEIINLYSNGKDYKNVK